MVSARLRVVTAGNRRPLSFVHLRTDGDENSAWQSRRIACTREQQALDDRGLIRHQMRLGSGLIAFGALSIPLFQMTGVLDGQTATAAFAVATGVIGAGAAMLPTGAAAGASARILRSLPDQDDATNQGGKIPVLRGTEASNGQADKSTQRGQ